MTAKIDGTNGVLQQYDYQVPTTGFSYTFAAGTTVLVMNPAGTLATGTITMPAAPVDGMTISFSSTKTITALTVAGNTGQSIVGQPTYLIAGGAATFVYRLSNTTWYAQTNTANISTGVPVLNVYTSPGTWTKPATVKAIKVTVIGGGANGTSAGPNQTQAGPGGGSGGTSIKSYPAPSLPGPQPYTVGAVGATSSFGVAPVTVITATGASGATAGAGSSGDINLTGQAGGPSTASNVAIGGAGGSTILGFGGPSVATNPAGQVNGMPATGYGAGGGGAARQSPTPLVTNPGGSGTAGVVVVEEFY